VRARALRARLFELIATPKRDAARPPRPSQLRCLFFDPQKNIKSIRPTHRSFADPSGNILGSKLYTGATIRTNFFQFIFSLVFGSIPFVILFFFFSPFQFLILLFLFIS
jgi:hypothetical protein